MDSEIMCEFQRERRTFDSHCPNAFELSGREVDGKQVLAYRFSSPAGGCFSIRAGYETYSPAVTGQVLIRDPGGMVVQFEYEAKEFPREFPLADWKWETSWHDVKIGDVFHLVPVAAGLVTVDSDAVPSTGLMTRMAREYKNHRHFESSSSIEFQ